MKLIIHLSFVGLVFLLSSCDPETGLLTIFGKVLSDNDIKIGLFALSPDVNGDYSITFPDDISQVGFLWRIHGIRSISNQAE